MRHSSGFTLVELLLVIFLLSSLALVTTLFVDNANEQYRFETTRTRLEQIRRAIVGDTSRTLNGQPEISGFVADMGRLPANLQELIELGGQAEWNLHTVNTSGLSPVVVELHGGWRGPYLEAVPESDGMLAFRDGWGNAGAAPNYGWIGLTEDAGALLLQSLGSDGIADGDGGSLEMYAKDYPSSGLSLVVPNDYRMSLNNGLTVTFNQEATDPAPTSVYLRLYFVNDGVINTNFDLDSLNFPSISGVRTVNVSFDTTDPKNHMALMGRYAAVVMCDVNNNGDPSDDIVFDGDCTSNPVHTNPYYFTLVPRRQLPNIPWHIQ